MPTLNDIVGSSTSGATQTFFVDNFVIVEPLDGPTSVEDIYDRFPSEVYQQSRDTHLFALLTALCGDSGAGLAKKQSYVARLKYEASFLNFTVLDQIYDAQFKLHRLKSETYDGISTHVANTDDIWDLAQKADSDYFQRIQEFWTGTRSGNSPSGVQLVAQAGSGLDVEIVEHYKYIYDQFSDDPLGLDPDGISVATEEFVVIPRYDPEGTYHYIPDVLPEWHFTPPVLVDAPAVNRRIVQLGVNDTNIQVSPVYADGIPVLNPDVERNTLDLLDRIRPQDSFCTFRLEEVTWLNVTLPNPTASSIFLSLIRYVSGNPKITWPTIDPTTNRFIAPNVENPSGSFATSATAMPVTFYTIPPGGVAGYTDQALQDPTYGTAAFFIPESDGIAPIDAYRSEHSGPFFEPLTQIYPNLSGQKEASTFPAAQAPAINNTPLVMRGSS